jgi:ribosomal protein L11 methyltransferase
LISDCGLQIAESRSVSLIRDPKFALGISQMTPQVHNPQSSIPNHWWLVTVRVKRDAVENASALLFDLGSTGIITLDETSDVVKLGAYFDESAETDAITNAIEAQFSGSAIEISAVLEEDWMQKWKEGFEPVRIGERLMIAPSWKLPKKTEGREIIQIDPGMAFGTGTHETTQLCLQALERYWRGGRLLDVGTGTGILAIAAARLVPDSRVVAIEVDPQALEVARENIAINRVSDSVELLEARPEGEGDEFDVIVANLTAEAIVGLIDDLATRLSSNGLMILSGVLNEFAEDVERSLVRAGFKVTEISASGEWCALIAQRDLRC